MHSELSRLRVQAVLTVKVCEEPKPGGTTAAVSSAPKVPLAVAPVTQAFNWGAAGSAPKSAGADVWKCPTCMLSNPNDAAKCTVSFSSRYIQSHLTILGLRGAEARSTDSGSCPTSFQLGCGWFDEAGGVGGVGVLRVYGQERG